MGRTMEFKVKLSKFIKSNREAAGLTQWQVAKELGYSSPQFISNWERDAASIPVKKARKLGRILRVPLPEIKAAMEEELVAEFNRKF